MSTELDVQRNAPSDGMRDPLATSALSEYLRQTWQRRSYTWYVARNELRRRQMATVLGNLWHLLNPALLIAVYYIIFGRILNTDRGLDNFLPYLAIGVFTYNFAQRATMAGAKSIQKSRGLIKSVTFPRVLLPWTSTLTESLAAIPAFAVMLIVCVATGEDVRFTWLGIIPSFVVLCVFSFGLAMIAARAAHLVADVQQLLPFMFRLGFYASGVLFNVEAYVPEHRELFLINPFYCFIEINRALLLPWRAWDPALVLSTGLWTAVVAIAGFWWFRAGEDTYARD